MTPERLTALLGESRLNGGLPDRLVVEIVDGLDAANAAIARLRSSASQDVETLIHAVAMAAWDHGAECGIVWDPDADMSKRGVVPLTQEEGLQHSREHFAEHGTGSPVGPFEKALAALYSRLRSSPVPVADGPTDEECRAIVAEGIKDEDGEIDVFGLIHSGYELAMSRSPAPVAEGLPDFSHPDIEEAVRLGFQLGASRLPALKPGEVEIPEPTGIVVDLPERYREKGVELVRQAIQWARENAKVRTQPTPTEKETGHG
jgi:hypothetical protein